MSGPSGVVAPYQVVTRWPVPDAPAESVGFDEVEQVIAGLPARIGYTDQLTDNMVRAGFALDAVSAYARRTGTYRNESVGTVVSDLCNDLRHLCDLIGVDWDLASEPGHYDHEVRHQD